MQPINHPSGAIYTFTQEGNDPCWVSGSLPLSMQSGHIVKSYHELLEKCAIVKFYNNHYSILYRGQRSDWMAGTHSSLYPSIYRNISFSSTGSHSDSKTKLLERYATLDIMERRLEKALISREVYHDRMLRWSLLQHYEVCPTPLFDLTTSLQVALSFALEESTPDAYLYLLAVPHLTGPFSVSLEAGTQAIQLSQFCPPSALRPHFQEAVLVGSYPTPDKAAIEGGTNLFAPYLGQNFACRLIAKFHLQDCSKWNSEGFSPIVQDIMYPNRKDGVFKATEHLKSQS